MTSLKPGDSARTDGHFMDERKKEHKMLKRALLTLMLSNLFTCAAVAQISYCATHPEKVACTFSTLYTFPIPGTNQIAFPQPDPFSAIAANVGSQLAQLPLASPASGIIYNLNPVLGVETPSNETFGPVFAERGETIGRGKYFVASTYQDFSFSSIDGIDMKHLPTVFRICEGTCTDFGTTNRVDVKVNQFAIFATMGLTSRIDLSIAIPILDVRVGASVTGCTPHTTTGVNCVTPVLSFGLISITPGTFTSRGATGVGDIVARAKVQVLKGERYRMAVGLDVRLPTGDELNLLGTGAKGFKPFVAFSRRGRLSPHANVGYQYNGSSDLGGAQVGDFGNLPDDLSYSGGFDFRAHKRLTLAADFLGDRFTDAKRMKESEVQIGTTQSGSPLFAPSASLVKGAFESAKGSFGVKINPFGNFLLTANVLQRFDHNGLRNRIVPLVGASYTF
jgi:hypothetical protein